jgi:hypothetical protein
MGYPILTAKTIHQGRIAAHGPLQSAQAQLRTEPKLKDKRSSLPALLRFVRPLFISPDPRDVIQALEPCDIIEALDPFTQTPPRSTPTITRYHGPLPFLVREQELAASCRITRELVTPDS